MRLALLVAVLALVPACCPFSAPYHQGPRSNHFDGWRFFNPGERIPEYGANELLRWRFNRDRGPWREWVDAEPGPPPPRRVEGETLRVTWVNHATLLLQTAGLNILTDPVWSRTIGPVRGIGSERHRPPGLRFEDLPPIDVVVVSHNHYDHMDMPTLERLARAHEPRFFVGLGNAPLLEAEGIDRVRQLDWWQSVPLTDEVTLHSVRVRHFSNRSTCDRDRTLWTGWLVDAPGGPIYFAGDTSMGSHFAMARERYGPMRLALLPIAPARPEWFMRPVHVLPREAVEAHRILEAQTSIAMHYGTFRLGDDGEHEPVRRLRAAFEEDDAEHFWVVEHGRGRRVPPLP